MTYEAIRQDDAIQVYITQADASLQALGFTEHSFPHVTRVAKIAGDILQQLGYADRQRRVDRLLSRPCRENVRARQEPRLCDPVVGWQRVGHGL